MWLCMYASVPSMLEGGGRHEDSEVNRETLSERGERVTEKDIRHTPLSSMCILLIQAGES